MFAKPLIESLLHLFFPHNCLGCHTDMIAPGQVLCATCFINLPETNLFEQEDNPLEHSFHGRVNIRHAAAAFYYSKDSLIQQLVYSLKYRGAKEAGEFLGTQLGMRLEQCQRFSDVDLIIPLPLNEKKLRRRGYNQAEIIARAVAEVWPKPVNTTALVRTIFTETQTKKDRQARWQTMEGVFVVADAKALEGKHILLIDDIITTGATIEACAGAINSVKGTSISLASVAWTN